MAEIGLHCSQPIVVDFPTERTGRLLVNGQISSPPSYLSCGCWQVTEAQSLRMQNGGMQTNLNPLLELTLGICGLRTLILFIDDFTSLVLV